MVEKKSAGKTRTPHRAFQLWEENMNPQYLHTGSVTCKPGYRIDERMLYLCHVIFRATGRTGCDLVNTVMTLGLPSKPDNRDRWLLRNKCASWSCWDDWFVTWVVLTAIGNSTVPNISRKQAKWHTSSHLYRRFVLYRCVALTPEGRVYWDTTFQIWTLSWFPFDTMEIYLKYTNDLFFFFVKWPPLWSSGQSSWLLTQRSRVRFPAPPNFLSSSGSGKVSAQPSWG
jgi:hypothetical protein